MLCCANYIYFPFTPYNHNRHASRGVLLFVKLVSYHRRKAGLRSRKKRSAISPERVGAPSPTSSEDISYNFDRLYSPSSIILAAESNKMFHKPKCRTLFLLSRSDCVSLLLSSPNAVPFATITPCRPSNTSPPTPSESLFRRCLVGVVGCSDLPGLRSRS